jgi:hypothetical protein
MSGIKHTPGKWWASGLEVGTAPMMDVKIARVSGANFDEAKANACLISAAPELLEALILLEAEMVASGNAGSVDYGWKPAIEKTRAAIAKARGEA